MQLDYNITKDTKTATEKATYIGPGIHTNVKMVKAAYEVSKNGNEFLTFTIENERGDKISRTEWPISLKKAANELTTKDIENAQKVIDGQKEKLKQIVEAYFTKEELINKPFILEGISSFKDLAEKALQFLGDKYKDVNMRIKAVYDRKGWVTFGQSAWSVFIEPMTVSEEDSKIRILPSDVLIRPAQPDDKKKETNPEDVIDTPTMLDAQVAEKADDLPF